MVSSAYLTDNEVTALRLEAEGSFKFLLDFVKGQGGTENPDGTHDVGTPSVVAANVPCHFLPPVGRAAEPLAGDSRPVIYQHRFYVGHAQTVDERTRITNVRWDDGTPIEGAYSFNIRSVHKHRLMIEIVAEEVK